MVSILAIGAHPDDIELGCSATLIKHKKHGDKIYLQVLSRGEASGDPEIRERECRKAAELMGADKIVFGELKDTKIDDGINTIMAIERMINEINPDVIYTHSFKDTHQDHRNTSYATLSAGRRSKKILMYESPTTFRDFQPQLFVDIKDEFEKKKTIMRLYSSQSQKEWWAIGHRAAMAVEGLAAYRGFQAGVEVAEAFEVGKLVITANEQIFNNINEEK
ncbi:MAG: PIG-L deacetylase family protein [Candidatus Hodarchaeota archaeon]